MTGLYDEIMQLLHDTRMSVEGDLQEKVSQALRNVRLAAEAEFQANPAPQGHGIRA